MLKSIERSSRTMNQSEIKWLTDRLPAIEKIKLKSDADKYGISHIIASKLNRNTHPRSFSQWQHGWIYNDEPIRNAIQLVILGTPNQTQLVANERYVTALKQFGFEKCEAVGLPYIYADNIIEFPRKSGSLLVMPPHSLPHTNHNWDEETYASQIVQLKPYFSCIIACIHTSCVTRGYWTSALERHSIPWITGASADDRNALLRMKCLFNSFEYMTTNVIGSHVAYASYSGCKVSLYGSYAEYKEKDYENDGMMAKHPEFFKNLIENSQETVIRKRFPHLFTSPMEAVENKEWGSEMLGARYKREAEEIAELLGWSFKKQLYGYSTHYFNLLKRPDLMQHLSRKTWSFLKP